MLIWFTVSLRTRFVLKTVYGFSNHQQHLFALKKGPQLPLFRFVPVCLGQKGELLYTRRGLRLNVKVLGEDLS